MFHYFIDHFTFSSHLQLMQVLMVDEVKLLLNLRPSEASELDDVPVILKCLLS